MNAPSELASRFQAPLQIGKKLGISGHLALQWSYKEMVAYAPNCL